MLGSRFSRSTAGGTAVEVAIAMPVFLFLTLGTIDLCLFLWQWNSANKAVQLGARLAIVSGPVSSNPNLAAVNWAALNPTNLGTSCISSPSSCPSFSAITCKGSGTGACTASAISPILQKMQGVYPQLQSQYVGVTYALNNLGFVGRPGPMPTNVTVSISGQPFNYIVLGGLAKLFGSTLTAPTVNASATLPSEDLVTN